MTGRNRCVPFFCCVVFVFLLVLVLWFVFFGCLIFRECKSSLSSRVSHRLERSGPFVLKDKEEPLCVDPWVGLSAIHMIIYVHIYMAINGGYITTISHYPGDPKGSFFSRLHWPSVPLVGAPVVLASLRP